MRRALLLLVSLLGGIGFYFGSSDPLVAHASCFKPDYFYMYNEGGRGPNGQEDMFMTLVDHVCNDQYAGGFGDRYFTSISHDLRGGNNPPFQYVEVRVWVCGTYEGAWANTVSYYNLVSVSSPWFSYRTPNTCGPQSDNYGSYIEAYDFNYYGTPYVNFDPPLICWKNLLC